MDRNETIKAIKANLQRRSGKAWSVTGGRGTAWGWLTIASPPKRSLKYGYLQDADRSELAQLLALDNVHNQGVSIPSSNGHYQEYLDRSAGIEPTVHGEQYWD